MCDDQCRNNSTPPEDQIFPLSSDSKAAETSETENAYSVSEPEERVYPSGRYAEQGSDEDAGGVTLESIYERRRKQNDEKEADGTERYDLEPLPKHPFFTRVFRPLVNPGMLMKLGFLTCLLWGLFSIVFPIFQRVSSRAFHEETKPHVSVETEVKVNGRIVKKMMTADSLTERLSSVEKFFLGAKGEIVFGAFRKYGYFFLFALIPWGIAAVPVLLQVTEQTSEGDDRIAEWPSDWASIETAARFCWFLLLVAAAGIPGYFLFAAAGLARLGFVLSFFLLFPVFYLSTADTDSLFCLLSKNTLRGIKLAPGAWRDWLILSLILGLAVWTAIFIPAGYGMFHIQGILRLIILAFISAFCTTWCAFLFFRFLGRMAWVMRDKLQKETEQKASEEV